VTATADAAPRARKDGFRRRFDNLVLRWQARLDSAWADRVVPWAAAGVFFLILASLALAQARALQTGQDLGTYAQAAWLINRGEAPVTTITDLDLFAEQAGVGFYLVAWLTKVLPTIPTLLVVQSAALAVGMVPLWRLARRVAHLRVGAAGALLVAYALYPALQDLNLADYHQASLAVPALLGAALFGLEGRWIPFGLCCAAAMVCRADYGLVIMGMGALLAIEGNRRAGLITAGVALFWTIVALQVIQPDLADGAFVHADAFASYGSTPLGVAWGMLTSPLEVLGDIFSEENFRLLVILLAPVFFLPVIAPRYLLPALPLEALYLVANASDERAARPEHVVPMLAFVFVATVFALSRIGRPSIERVNVDRRVLGALMLASLVFFVQEADSSPYQDPWAWGADASDTARRDAADLVPEDAAVRASPSMLPLVAEREDVEVLVVAANPHVRRAADGVDVIAFDEESAPDWGEEQRRLFVEGLAELGFARTFDEEGIQLYVRVGVSEDDLDQLGADDP
jgi:uncharacterized membrane protein